MKYVSGAPTKRFFVHSIVRDISLTDAILDLLDNSLDGVVRDLNMKDKETDDYSGYWAKIIANKNEFNIEDNCGGIPTQIAEEYAFQFGREDETIDDELPTVGMYGIGLKRAIFKLGTAATVFTRNTTDEFTVDVPKAWIEGEDWNFQVIDFKAATSDRVGTKVTIKDLHPSISSLFRNDESPFLEDLHKQISQLFALIIKKGFKVYLNGTDVAPAPLNILKSINNDTDQISPYLYKDSEDGVDTKIVVGFYQSLSGTNKALENPSIAGRMADNAGISVICNDRVVLYNDKTRITGWGQNTVPSFHNQFLNITGILSFKANDSDDLPVTTTKRGLDASSEIYLRALNYLTEGIKLFTDFTNHWKGHVEASNKLFSNQGPVDAMDLLKNDEDFLLRKIPKLNSATRYKPYLPRPIVKRESSTIRIAFRRDKSEFEELAEALGMKSETPSEVGEYCYTKILKEYI